MLIVVQHFCLFFVIIIIRLLYFINEKSDFSTVYAPSADQFTIYLNTDTGIGH